MKQARLISLFFVSLALFSQGFVAEVHLPKAEKVTFLLVGKNQISQSAIKNESMKSGNFIVLDNSIEHYKQYCKGVVKIDVKPCEGSWASLVKVIASENKEINNLCFCTSKKINIGSKVRKASDEELKRGTSETVSNVTQEKKAQPEINDLFKFSEGFVNDYNNGTVSVVPVYRYNTDGNFVNVEGVDLNNRYRITGVQNNEWYEVSNLRKNVNNVEDIETYYIPFNAYNKGLLEHTKFLDEINSHRVTMGKDELIQVTVREALMHNVETDVFSESGGFQIKKPRNGGHILGQVVKKDENGKISRDSKSEDIAIRGPYKVIKKFEKYYLIQQNGKLFYTYKTNVESLSESAKNDEFIDSTVHSDINEGIGAHTTTSSSSEGSSEEKSQRVLNSKDLKHSYEDRLKIKVYIPEDRCKRGVLSVVDQHGEMAVCETLGRGLTSKFTPVNFCAYNSPKHCEWRRGTRSDGKTCYYRDSMHSRGATPMPKTKASDKPTKAVYNMAKVGKRDWSEGTETFHLTPKNGKKFLRYSLGTTTQSGERSEIMLHNVYLKRIESLYGAGIEAQFTQGCLRVSKACTKIISNAFIAHGTENMSLELEEIKGKIEHNAI